MAKILFVDWDILTRVSYVEELQESGYEVVNCQELDGAAATFESTPDAFDLVVTGLMVPPGSRFGALWERDSQRVPPGILFRDFVRKLRPLCLVILFSNFGHLLRENLRPDDPNELRFNKRDFCPDQFAREIGKILQERKAQPQP